MSEDKGESPIPERIKRSTLSPEERAVRVARNWKKGTITEFDWDSTLEHYEHLLGFDRRSLEGKTILDLGTSPSDKLARDIRDAGIHATVISLSPDFQDESISNYPTLPKGWKGNRVAGIAQTLPFKNESFDMILGAYSVTWAASTFPEQIKAWVSEIGRVLKPGGEARVGPNYGPSSYSTGKNFEKMKEWARNFGLDIEIDSKFVFRKLQTS